MDCSAIVLNKVLEEKNLDIWSRLKLVYLDPAFSSLYSAIKRYYDKYSALPSFDDLELTLREGPTLKTLATIRLAEIPDIDPEVALDALIDQYTQDQTIILLDKFVDKLPQYDTKEIKDSLSTIVLTLDEKTLTTDNIFSMSDMMIFRHREEIAGERVFLNLNNTFDATLGGVAKEELILIGGHRGSGKSIVCSNIVCNQYEQGNVVPYFTIEMIAQEVHERNMAILANVDHQNIRKGTCTPEEILRIVQVRADMYVDAQDLVEQYHKDRDQYKFEAKLVREKTLKSDNQIIIIDDRALTLTSIDLHLSKLKARFGDKLRVAVVDYVNKIVVESQGQFDWQPQIIVADRLKNLARKHDLVMVSPYQIDQSGEARFAKGILDSADIAAILKASKDPGTISFETTKIRGGPQIKVTSGIDWGSLRIDPTNIEAPKPEESEEPKKSKKDKLKTGEPSVDAPW